MNEIANYGIALFLSEVLPRPETGIIVIIWAVGRRIADALEKLAEPSPTTSAPQDGEDK
jgi:hypothetical protein